MRAYRNPFRIGGNEFATGTILGTVTGNPAPGIEGVTVEANGYDDTTDENGNYRIKVPVGTYDVTASHDDYKKKTVENVEVGGNAEVEIDFELSLAEVFFEITIDETNSPVTEGEDLDVDVTVENTGNVVGTQTINLMNYYGVVVDSQEISDLGAGDTENITLTWETGVNDAGGGEIEVFSDDVSVAVFVTVNEIDTTMLLDEDFNDEFPEGWDIIVQDGTIHAWSRVENRVTFSLDGTPFMIADSDAAGVGPVVDTSLKTPEINIPNSQDRLMLSFEHYYRHLGSSSGKVQVYDGTEWVVVKEFEETTGSWADPEEEEIDITNYANDKLRVSFRYTDDGDWAWFWAIDNVKIEVVE